MDYYQYYYNYSPLGSENGALNMRKVPSLHKMVIAATIVFLVRLVKVP